MRSRRERIAVYDFPRHGGGRITPGRGKDIFVRAQAPGARIPDGGSDSDTGVDWDHALLTMAGALAKAATGDRIFFCGKLTEEIAGSNLLFDITIQGVGGLHHADQPGSGTDLYDHGSAIWAPPSSPTATTPLLKIRGRGWKVLDVMFDCPVDSAALYLERNASSGTDEYDASHAVIRGCRFVDGKYGIQDVGGCYNVTVEGCEFKAMTTCAIVNTSSAVANPLNWKIKNNDFPSNVSSFGNATHIDSPLNCAIIKENQFGTVTSTALYVDLTGGNGNIVTRNVMAGNYATDDYVSGTGDVWYENYCKVTVTTAPDGRSILVPAA